MARGKAKQLSCLWALGPANMVRVRGGALQHSLDGFEMTITRGPGHEGGAGFGAALVMTTLLGGSLWVVLDFWSSGPLNPVDSVYRLIGLGGLVVSIVLLGRAVGPGAPLVKVSSHHVEVRETLFGVQRRHWQIPLADLDTVSLGRGRLWLSGPSTRVDIRVRGYRGELLEELMTALTRIVRERADPVQRIPKGLPEVVDR